MTAVTNKAAAEGGADEEDDEALLERVRIKWATPSTGGNLGDYQRWAIDVAGVADVKAFNPSAGNVKVYIVGVGNTQASAELVQEDRRQHRGKQTCGGECDRLIRRACYNKFDS